MCRRSSLGWSRGAQGYPRSTATCLTGSSGILHPEQLVANLIVLGERVPRCCRQENGLQGSRRMGIIWRWGMGDGRWEKSPGRRHPMKHETLAHLQQFPIFSYSFSTSYSYCFLHFFPSFFFLAKYVSCDFGNLQWVFHIRMYIHTFSEKNI